MSLSGDGYLVRSLAVTFRAGARLGGHAHPWGQLVFASSGVMHVETVTEAWIVPATKAIWLPSGLIHSIQIHGEVAMRTLYLAAPCAEVLPPSPVALEVAPLLRELILHICGLGMLGPEPAPTRLAGVLTDLLHQARREDLVLPLPQDARALRLSAHFRQKPEDRRELADLAQEAGASLRTLQRVFRTQTGMTAQDWRRKARLVHALTLLCSGASVTQTASDAGYESLGAFITAFTRQFGTTPGRYGAAAFEGRAAILDVQDRP
jgi:AraC-like DNA-binding protein